jgi:hypothetical protein
MCFCVIKKPYVIIEDGDDFVGIFDWQRAAWQKVFLDVGY